jgi:hypothetical protein
MPHRMLFLSMGCLFTGTFKTLYVPSETPPLFKLLVKTFPSFQPSEGKASIFESIQLNTDAVVLLISAFICYSYHSYIMSKLNEEEKGKDE